MMSPLPTPNSLDIIDFLFFASGLFSFYLAATTYRRGNGDPIYSVYTIVALSYGLAAISLGLLGSMADPAFGKLSIIFFLISIGGLPLFMYLYPQRAWPPIVLWLGYIPLLGVIGLVPFSIVVKSVKISGGLVLPEAGTWIVLLPAVCLLYLVLTVVIYIARYLKATEHNRRRIQYIGYGLLALFVLSGLSVIAFPLLGNFSYFTPAPLAAYMVMLFMLALALHRQDVTDIRVITTEVGVFLAFGLVLLNTLFRSTEPIVLAANAALLLMFLILATRRVALVTDLIHQRQELATTNGRLKELMDMKTEFLQIASHQIRAPLTSVYGLVKMEASGYFEELAPAKRQEFREKAVQSVDRLRMLVNDLLRALRLEGGKLPLNFSQVDLVPLIQESMDSLRLNYEKRDLKLEFINPPKLGPITADGDYLRQVFINLIDNAERYTEKGGVTVTVHQEKDVTVSEITDTGIGIEPTEKKELFEKFARAQRARAVRSEGTGLGLFIVRKILEAHGGSIELISAGANKGTTAKVIIPTKPPVQAAVENSSSADQQKKTANPEVAANDSEQDGSLPQVSKESTTNAQGH